MSDFFGALQEYDFTLSLFSFVNFSRFNFHQTWATFLVRFRIITLHSPFFFLFNFTFANFHPNCATFFFWWFSGIWLEIFLTFSYWLLLSRTFTYLFMFNRFCIILCPKLVLFPRLRIWRKLFTFLYFPYFLFTFLFILFLPYLPFCFP